MAALLYYDFVLTLPKEIRYIWNQRFILSTALYIGCRYALLANVLYLLAIADKLGSTVSPAPLDLCDLWYKIIAALSTLGRVSVITVFVVRTSVFYGGNRWITAYMGILGLACITLGITHVPGLHCKGSSTLPMCVQFRLAPIEASLLTVIVAVDDFGADPVAVAHAEVQMWTEVQLSGGKERNIDTNVGTRSACLGKDARKGAITRDGAPTESEIEPV
ncbi:hypothetical protein C8R45DRAFT_836609 [Mycena sanguinolenta]|nr:hypothetical protein C8R45DRAFT_836609 [Mycena sanguinolenta]